MVVVMKIDIVKGRVGRLLICLKQSDYKWACSKS